MKPISSRNRLSFAYMNITALPPDIEKYAYIQELDFSNNQISDLFPLANFINLEILILDNNQITSQTRFPRLPQLHTLYINSNQVSNLSIFIDKLAESLPSLKYFSMLNNEACPNYFNGGSLTMYNDYRHYVVSRLRSLVHLETSAVTEEERQEAYRKYPPVTNPMQTFHQSRVKKGRSTSTLEQKKDGQNQQQQQQQTPQNKPKVAEVVAEVPQIKDLSNEWTSDDGFSDSEFDLE